MLSKSPDSNAPQEALEQRLVELEMRSEERRMDCERLETFVRAYESRIESLESELSRMRELLQTPLDGPPPADEDLPPHY